MTLKDFAHANEFSSVEELITKYVAEYDKDEAASAEEFQNSPAFLKFENKLARIKSIYKLDHVKLYDIYDPIFIEAETIDVSHLHKIVVSSDDRYSMMHLNEEEVEIRFDEETAYLFGEFKNEFMVTATKLKNRMNVNTANGYTNILPEHLPSKGRFYPKDLDIQNKKIK